jgi:DNA-binding transcriptional regulator YiaG
MRVTNPTEFRAARESLGLDRASLAKVLNVHHDTVARWENDFSKRHRKPDPIACRLLEILAGDEDMMARWRAKRIIDYYISNT